MPYIPIDSLIADMNPAQKILCQQFYSVFDSRSAANRKIANVEPLYYDGLIAGSEFETYAATKMYLCFEFGCGVLAANISGAVTAYVSIFDETNTITYSLNELAVAFSAAAIYVINNFHKENFLFSRLVTANYTYMKFLGYRITLV